MNFPIPLTCSTKSVQLPSPSASSVMTMVPLCADFSKLEAALMLRAHCTLMPRALKSLSMAGSGPLFATMMTALGSFSPGIIVSLDLHASGPQFRIAVSYRKLCVSACPDLSSSSTKPNRKASLQPLRLPTVGRASLGEQRNKSRPDLKLRKISFLGIRSSPEEPGSARAFD
jgi:hypothetical protein